MPVKKTHRPPLLFTLFVRYRKLILGCDFRLLLIFSRSLLRAVGMTAGVFVVLKLASWRWGVSVSKAFG